MISKFVSFLFGNKEREKKYTEIIEALWPFKGYSIQVCIEELHNLVGGHEEGNHRNLLLY